MESELEASVVAGSSLAGEILKDSGQTIPTSGVGSGKILPVELAGRFFEIESNGQRLEPTELRVLSDGLEAMFIVRFPKPSVATFQVVAKFAPSLPSSGFCALVVADENNRLLGSHVVTAGNSVAKFTLPAVAIKSEAVVEDAQVSKVAVEAVESPEATSTDVAAKPTFGDYFKMGIYHILAGPDHLLFLCGLLVVSRKLGGTLLIITSFTLAHSVTLGLAALDIVSLPSKIVEPIIAASIIFVGIENFRRGESLKARCWLAFGFGLIHGFGLAGALREAGLGSTASAIMTALFSFNIGVESGQIVVAAVFLAALWQLRKSKTIERHTTPVVSVLVIALGAFWLIQRLSV